MFGRCSVVFLRDRINLLIIFFFILSIGMVIVFLKVVLLSFVIFRILEGGVNNLEFF